MGSKAERGQRLRELRNAAGLSQEAVGAEFAITKQAVGSWESGASRPDVHKLRKLDDLYAAGGRVLAAFDLGSADINQLRDRLDVAERDRDELRRRLEESRAAQAALAQRVEDLGVGMKRLEKQVAQVRQASAGGGHP